MRAQSKASKGGAVMPPFTIFKKKVKDYEY